MITRDRIRGMVIGGGVGDAMGMPVETWSPEKIATAFPDGIKDFKTPKDHKWFDPEKTPAGSTTDDTQLTVATMKGIIRGHQEALLEDKPDFYDYYMHGISLAHCNAFKETTAGWGNTTREAVRRLCNGVSWKDSGKTDDPHRGTGNGVPMKCAPLAALINSPIKDKLSLFCIDYSAMTHYTKMSAMSCITHTNAVAFCLALSPSRISQVFNPMVFLLGWPEDYRQDLNETDGDMTFVDRMGFLSAVSNQLVNMEQKELLEVFGDGSCHIMESVPLAYAYFMKDPLSFQNLERVILAGGDTDTNAKMVGEMMGALHGLEAIKTYLPWAVETLVGYNELLETADKFCETLNIKD